jgi:predicted nuclease of predicted toxin-antitoxin system
LNGILLDENVPNNVSFKPKLSISHATDLGSSCTDTEIWRHAREHKLVIITKDADFSNRIMLSSPPPWIVHIRFGNMKRKDFHTLLQRLWPQIELLLPENKLINVFQDKIEAIRG